MSKSIQLKNNNNEKMYPHPYYPVGSIYLSVNDTNPATWFGGTWEQIAKGRTLVGVDTNDTDFNTVQKTGGEKIHTLTVNEIPNHPHSLQMAGTRLDANGNNVFRMQTGVGGNGGNFWSLAVGRTGTGTHDATITSACGGQAHNNLQPYFTCYIWCRTA